MSDTASCVGKDSPPNAPLEDVSVYHLRTAVRAAAARIAKANGVAVEEGPVPKQGARGTLRSVSVSYTHLTLPTNREV